MTSGRCDEWNELDADECRLWLEPGASCVLCPGDQRVAVMKELGAEAVLVSQPSPR